MENAMDLNKKVIQSEAVTVWTARGVDNWQTTKLSGTETSPMSVQDRRTHTTGVADLHLDRQFNVKCPQTVN